MLEQGDVVVHAASGDDADEPVVAPGSNHQGIPGLFAKDGTLSGIEVSDGTVPEFGDIFEALDQLAFSLDSFEGVTALVPSISGPGTYLLGLSIGWWLPRVPPGQSGDWNRHRRFRQNCWSYLVGTRHRPGTP